ncbi:hypothetical protein BBBOND_0100040 [Babesia bigemina]|uniref:Uncharacterized protein n=1 Tax=Babesia bigemina TaxID=5866 RepID=A0A061D7G8_BABBI|nr:hypothetical protein BBBOND_0100040 [Babesia bigemina]CDR93675.1 hypothetical protein BBBOND_0100040 [Babesia bigemina]|eukprot:XP_012765861.1 hypothetical protein BBBOND_0100040 [Babesia bigemina]
MIFNSARPIKHHENTGVLHSTAAAAVICDTVWAMPHHDGPDAGDKSEHITYLPFIRGQIMRIFTTQYTS